MLVFDDSSIHPSLYNLWRDIEFRYAPGLITESDMYFPDQKLAVFCDSTRHHRGGKAKAKDAAIDEKLAKIGLSSVRVPGKLIVEDVKAAADLVSNALANTGNGEQHMSYTLGQAAKAVRHVENVNPAKHQGGQDQCRAR